MKDEKFMKKKKIAMIKTLVYGVIMLAIGALTLFSIQGSDFGFLSSFLMAPVPIGVMLFSIMMPIIINNMDKSLAWPPPSFMDKIND